MKKIEKNELFHAPLGKETEYKSHYDAGLLFPISRQLNREKIGVTSPDDLPFEGEDIWNAYEISWLNKKGKPMVATATIRVSCKSESIVESKSFKLYLNSFNQTQVGSIEELQSMMVSDLTKAFGGDVEVILQSVHQGMSAIELPDACFDCIDDLDIEATVYERAPNLLEKKATKGTYSLCSHLLKSNCPVTGQPDWASVFIRYEGQEICRESLLRYLISYREQQDFHEHCVETIYMDLWEKCCPEKLSVYARYTRRGGMDINPFRSNFEAPYGNWRIARQ